MINFGFFNGIGWLCNFACKTIGKELLKAFFQLGPGTETQNRNLLCFSLLFGKKYQGGGGEKESG